MLAKPYRLTKDKDFERLAREGRAVYGGELMLKWRLNNLKQSRFGFVVSKKVDKRAVVRNKIKRRLRAIVRENLSKIRPGYDVMILTRSEIKNLTFMQLKNKIDDLLIRAKLL